MKVTEVELLHAPMAASWLTERVIANPMSIYPEYVERRSSWYGQMTAGVIRITVEDGTQGLGFVGCAKGSAAAVALEEQVRALVVGKDCFGTELIQEQLVRATVFYGLGGFTQSLISGIDIALWDVKGKLTQRPVYDLLGGKTSRPPAPLPDLVGCRRPSRSSASATSRSPCRTARPTARTGMKANVEAVEAARELIGPDGFLALDCYMAWDVPYTIEMARRLRDYAIEWIEEPVLPEDVDGLPPHQRERRLHGHGRRAHLHARGVPAADRRRRRRHRAAGHLPRRRTDRI